MDVAGDRLGTAPWPIEDPTTTLLGREGLSLRSFFNMRLRRQATLGLVAAAMCSGLAIHAQNTTKLPRRAGSRPSEVLVIDDQVFDAEAVVIDKSGLVRPLGAATDSRDVGWGGSPFVKFRGWEGGVLPVEFEDGISEAQRDQFMRACEDWGRRGARDVFGSHDPVGICPGDIESAESK
jgi:hypothetical protein